MPRVEFYTAVETGDWVTAGATIALAFLVAEIVDRALKRRGKRLSSAVAVGGLSPLATTRLRLARRGLFAPFILFWRAGGGVGLAPAERRPRPGDRADQRRGEGDNGDGRRDRQGGRPPERDELD